MDTFDILVNNIPLKKYFSDEGKAFVLCPSEQDYDIRVQLAPDSKDCYIGLEIDGKTLDYCYRTTNGHRLITSLRLDTEHVAKLSFKRATMDSEQNDDDETPIDPLSLGTIKVLMLDFPI